MNILEAILLGVIQGVTEFLPISSSGHLEVLPRLFGWGTPSTVFMIMLHVGTFMAILIYFRKKIFLYFQALINFLNKKADKSKNELRIILRILVATIPAGILGYLLEKPLVDFYDNNLDNKLIFLLVAIPMIVIGIVFIVEKKWTKHHEKKIEEIKINNALVIGFAQALAFIRGVSRSGVTIISGRLVGLSRAEAAEFSFLMSIPILVVTSLYGFINLGGNNVSIEIAPIIVGTMFSFLSGYFSIAFLISFLKRNSLAAFGIYRVIFGAILILLFLF